MSSLRCAAMPLRCRRLIYLSLGYIVLMFFQEVLLLVLAVSVRLGHTRQAQVDCGVIQMKVWSKNIVPARVNSLTCQSFKFVRSKAKHGPKGNPGDLRLQ